MRQIGIISRRVITGIITWRIVVEIIVGLTITEERIIGIISGVVVVNCWERRRQTSPADNRRRGFLLRFFPFSSSYTTPYTKSANNELRLSAPIHSLLYIPPFSFC